MGYRYIAVAEDRKFLVEINERGKKVIVDGQTYAVDMRDIGDHPLFSLLIDNSSYEVFVEKHGGEYRVLIGGKLYTIEVQSEGHRQPSRVESDGEIAREEIVMRAPMPGLVMAVPVEMGQAVSAGQILVILESMKMENQLLSPVDGVVRDISVASGEVVTKGQILVVVE